MIIKSYEIQRKKLDILKCNFFLLYGENIGLKKDTRKVVSSVIKGQDKNIENISLYENEILGNEENFYDSVYSGSLFSSKKIIISYFFNRPFESNLSVTSISRNLSINRLARLCTCFAHRESKPSFDAVL